MRGEWGQRLREVVHSIKVSFVYGRQRTICGTEIVCSWRVLGWEVAVKVVVADLGGYSERFTLVTSARELTGLRMVELFAARFRHEGQKGLQNRRRAFVTRRGLSGGLAG
jgi:hypothetical protein